MVAVVRQRMYGQPAWAQTRVQNFTTVPLYMVDCQEGVREKTSVFPILCT